MNADFILKVNHMPEDDNKMEYPEGEDKKKMGETAMDAPPAGDGMGGGDPVLEAINGVASQLTELIGLLKPAEGMDYKSKEVPLEGPEGGKATAVEGPSDTEPADESDESGVPQTTTASTVEVDREMNKQNNASEVSKLQAELEAERKKLATLQKSLDGGNTGATRAPVEDPSAGSASSDEVELRRAHIQRLVKGGKVSTDEIFSASGLKEVHS